MNTSSKQPAAAPEPEPRDDKPQVEGEGSYTAARRHRESVEDFVDQGRVNDAARDAAPDSAAEADEMERAEEAGRERARGPDV